MGQTRARGVGGGRWGQVGQVGTGAGTGAGGDRLRQEGAGVGKRGQEGAGGGRRGQAGAGGGRCGRVVAPLTGLSLGQPPLQRAVAALQLRHTPPHRRRRGGVAGAGGRTGGRGGGGGGGLGCVTGEKRVFFGAQKMQECG